ncbi:MAG TPA: hypothetical protein VMI06_02500 [Terriglobia bacterium]|nr:hypothetical protein [Terriglobia bacterium]
MTFFCKRIPYCPPVIVCLSCAFLFATKAYTVNWSTIITAQTVRDMLSTPKGREQALQFCLRLHIHKVYIEVFRDGYEADPGTLRTARDFFRRAGFEVSGAVATTGIGKPSTGWKVVACYTHRDNQRRLAGIFRDAAGIFDEIIIDDFFFTDCECSECAAAKGDLSWKQYRKKLMLQVSRDDVLGPARQVNPRVRIILKYPQWYDKFQDRGYRVSAETKLYDRIWVGTELRDPSSERWGHKQQYMGFFIYRWLHGIGGRKTGGAWFDPYGTNPTFYLDQAYVSVLAGAPEILLFNLGTLDSPQYSSQVNALIGRESNLAELSTLVGGWRGIPAYKPPSSDPGKEPDIFDDIGMLAIPLLPVSTFPAQARAAFFADYALTDVSFVPELAQFLERGGTALLTEDLAHRLDQDPRLPGSSAIQLDNGEYFKTVEEGRGKIIVVSDDLPQLTYVDSQNRIEQPNPGLRSALLALRQAVENFTPTSLDAPPRVAVFPMGRRVAVMNFTELPVDCHLAGLAASSASIEQVFSTPGAALASDHKALRLPPHGLLVVE